MDGAAGPAGVDRCPCARYRGLSWTDDEGGSRPPSAALGAPGRSACRSRRAGSSPHCSAAAEMFAASGFRSRPEAGRTSARTPPALPPSAARSAVAVDWRGDLNFSAIGTVTYRDGDRVLIFGHPFFQSGEVRLPLSTAHIFTIGGILPSNNRRLAAVGWSREPLGEAGKRV